jgi:hypothetical protein
MAQRDLPGLEILMDNLIGIGVPIESIRVISAAVRQAVTDARKKKARIEGTFNSSAGLSA